MSEVVAEEQEPEAPDEQPAAPEEVEEEGGEPGQEEQAPKAPPEGQPEEPPPAGMSERELEQVRNKLERSATTWRNRVSELLGEEANYLVPCELCDPIIPGFHFPPEVESPRDDLHAHLLAVLKSPLAPEYSQAQHVRRCSTCDGWGRVLSGSRVAGKGEVTCPGCKGKGFQGDERIPGEQATANGQGEVEFPADTQPLVDDNTDVWGSPRLLDDGQENPNYGKMPQYKNPTLP